MGTGTAASAFEPAAVDPSVLTVGLRLTLSYAGFSAVLAIGVSVLVARLSRSLQEAQQPYADLSAEQAEREIQPHERHQPEDAEPGRRR